MKPKAMIYRDEYIVLSDVPEQEKQLIHKSIKKAVTAADGRVVVPWSWENAAWLSTVGLPAVSPVFRDYDFPMPPNWQLTTHQPRITDFVVRNRKAYVFSGTGTGKTAAITWACDYLLRIEAIKKVLIICPLSVMRDAWIPTINAILLNKHSVAELHHYNKKTRLKRLKENHTFYVINFDGIASLSDELFDMNFDVVVIDESTAIKNANTQRWKLIYPLVKKSFFTWLLTGTPVPQGPADAYGQIKMLDKFGSLRMPFSAWENETTLAVTEYKRVPKKGWMDIVFKYMRPAIKIETRDVVDLPPITKSYRNVPFTKTQQAAIDSLVKHNMVRLDGNLVEGDNKAIMLLKLAQICAGCVFDTEGNLIEVKPTPRLQEVLDLVQQSEGKVLIYAPFRGAVDLIAKHLQQHGIKCGVIHGGVSKTARQKLFNAFQREDKSVLQVLSAVPDAMAHGVTATAASHIIWYAPTAKSEIYLQANGRMERMGQTQRMQLTHLWGHQREKDLYEALQNMEAGQSALLKLYYKLTKGVLN